MTVGVAAIVKHRDTIDAALDHGLSQGLIESTNAKIRVLTRVAFGFHNPAALIALAMLALGGHRRTLPRRGSQGSPGLGDEQDQETDGRGTTGLSLAEVLRTVNPVLRGWAAYFSHGVSKKTFSYLGWYAWWRLLL